MIRFLESNGYDVSYFTGVDTARFPALILQHKTFVSVGHDEYWSGQARTNVEAARAAGVNLAFFSGNEVYWKTRWEASTDSSATAYRTLVCYKETWANAKIDPSPQWTGTWRDPRFSPPSDGGRPENALTGTIFMADDPATNAMTVPSTDANLRFWRNTSIANLQPGQTATLPYGLLGYEFDSDLDNGFRPAGLIDLSHTTVDVPHLMLDYGSTEGPGTATHSLTLYRASSGALVFGAGTVQWAWGLDDNHDRGTSIADVDVQQATVNLLADMSAQPATLMPGLVPATKSTDTTAPVSVITSPSSGTTVGVGDTVSVTGTATDTGGGVVGGVEVSIDGGSTWHPAIGRANWTYSWTPQTNGTVTIKSRAVDDSGNLESPGPGVSVTVGQVAVTCPCSIWSPNTTPALTATDDDQSVELGVKFRASQNGFITALRYYQSPTNTGTHIGHLWSTSGSLLSTVTFTNETGSGWQQASLPQPIAVTSGTTYVASYHTDTGNYSYDQGYFASSHVRGPLTALADGTDGVNGVYLYGTGFPTSSFASSNYWVDVVFNTTATDTTPPTITQVNASPATNGTSATVTWTTDEPSDSRVNYGTSSGSLNLNQSNAALVTSHSITLSGLSPNTTYFFQVRSADASGNAATSPATPASFQTPNVTQPGTFTDTTVADFSGGTGDAGTSITDTSGGELQLAPAAGSEFSGTTLPTGWTSSIWASGGSVSVAGGKMSVGAAEANTTALYNPGRSLEFTATFSGGAYQHIGFATDLNSPPWAIFSTKTGGALWARTAVSASSIQETQIPGSWLGTPHRFRIDWNATSVVYWIDGVQVASHTISPAVQMRPIASDFNSTAGSVVLDWMRMTPYASPGTFTSRVLDSAQASTWGAATWNAATPTGTSLQVSVRTGNTATPDGTWSAFAPLASSGASVGGPTARYLQYRVVLSTTDPSQTPSLTDITFKSTSGPDTTPPVITQVSASPATNGTSATITWTTDEPSTSRADYGTSSSALNLNQTNATLVTSHSITLNGLSPSTTYYFRVTSTDASGNAATSPPTTGSPASFLTATPDTTPPMITQVIASPATNGTSATITWTTDEPSDSRVNYGTSSGSLNLNQSNAALVTSHSITLSGLSPNTTYFFQVRSADASGNAATSPATPASFQTPAPDTTPPTITQVNASPATNGTSATVTWTTDEPSDSRVNYGTSSGSLNLNQSNAALVTSHSITLSGLSPNTTYFFQVRSADASGNAATSPATPASFQTPNVTQPGTFTDTTVADFSGGTGDAGTSITDTSGGELQLAPAAGSEFSGTTLPTGWTSSIWASGGSVSVAGGKMSVGAAEANTTALYNPGRSLEFTATFSGGAYQHIGFATDLNSPPWAIFSTKTGGALWARTAVSASSIQETQIPGSWLGTPHRFRIDWNATSVVYWIDGVQVASHTISPAVQMRPIASDFNSTAGSVVLDWMRMTPYASPGTFTSRVLDSAQASTWGAATWNAATPTGTSLQVSVRTGNTATPDGTWSAFAPLASSGASVGGPTARYLQYRVVLSTTDPSQTPSLTDITFAFG